MVSFQTSKADFPSTPFVPAIPCAPIRLEVVKVDPSVYVIVNVPFPLSTVVVIPFPLIPAAPVSPFTAAK